MFLDCYPFVGGYANKYLHHDDRSEDLAIEIMTRVWKKRTTITAASTFENYLFTIARKLPYYRMAEKDPLHAVSGTGGK